MKLILLSGLDGTGRLFSPFINSLSKKIETESITYPIDKELSYKALVDFVMEQLPKEEKFTLLAESFSGYIAYQIALLKPKNLKSLIFVATFLENPRPLLSKLLPFIPMRFILSLPMPKLIAKNLLLGDEILVKELQETLKEIPSKTLYFRLLEIVKLPKVTQKVKIRAIYIQATEDRIVSQRAYEVFAKLFSDIECIEVKGAHLILQESPRKSAVVVENFLKLV